MTNPGELSLAVARFLGYGITPHPDEDPARLVSEFGAETAARLERQVRQLLAELNDLKPDWSTQPLAIAGI